MITNEVHENRMLDYKEKLPGSYDSKKQNTSLMSRLPRMLQAVTSFMAFEKDVTATASQREFLKV